VKLASVAATLVAVAPAAAHHPTGPVETCSTQSGAGFPHAFTSRDNLVVGRLAMIGAGTFTDAQTVREFGGNKFPLLVAAGHTVTIEVTHRYSSLAYGSHWFDRDRAPRHKHIALGKRC
jgi:hypothetical protein